MNIIIERKCICFTPRITLLFCTELNDVVPAMPIFYRHRISLNFVDKHNFCYMDLMSFRKYRSFEYSFCLSFFCQTIKCDDNDNSRVCFVYYLFFFSVFIIFISIYERVNLNSITLVYKIVRNVKQNLCDRGLRHGNIIYNLDEKRTKRK